MRIYAVADIHGKPENLARIQGNLTHLQAELLLVAGDLTRYKDSKKVVSQLSRLPVPSFCISGNTDWPAVDRCLSAFPNTLSLHLSEQERDGIHFVGVSGTVPLPFRSRIRWRENTLMGKLAQVVTARTILMVHPPPYGTLDRALGRYHVGSLNLKRFLVKSRPRMVICGHVHEDSGVRQVGQTMVVNCALSKKCAGALIELDASTITKVKILDDR